MRKRRTWARNVRHDREHQRRDADRHRHARDPERRLQIGRRALAEAVGGDLELDQMPQQDAAKPNDSTSKIAADSARPARRQPRLHELDLMERVVDLAHRQADERHHHQHVAAELVRDLEREVQHVAGEDIEADHREHDDQRGFARPLAEPLDRAFPDRRLQVARRHSSARFGRGQAHRPSAARTLPSASTTSGPRDFAHSSQ